MKSKSTGSGAAKGITAEEQQRGNERERRRHEEERPVRQRREGLFLEDVLDPVGRGLEQPGPATRLGPRRFCIQALTLRSISVSSATPTMMMVNTITILMTLSRRKPFISGVIDAAPAGAASASTRPVKPRSA